MNKNDVVIVVGNVLDKYDTAVYSFLAPVFAPIFFPDCDPVMQLVLTYGTSITSVIARPCGAYFFGVYARHYGPLCALFYSLMGVAIMTVVIGCIPSYEVLGWYAPLCLLIARLLRGICAAGESTVAKLYIMENKNDHEALQASHIYQSSSMVGIVVASAVSTIVIGYGPQMWRMCFFAGGITAFVGLYMRMFFQQRALRQHMIVYENYTTHSVSLLWQEKSNVARVALVTIFSHMTYSIPFVFMNSFVPLVTGISLSTMMKYSTMFLVFDMAAVPLIGAVTKRLNPMYVMVCASFVLSCTMLPLFALLPGSSFVYVFCVRMWIVVWGIVFLCPLNFWCKRLFKQSESYFLVGMASAFGTGTLGHATTPLCLWLWYATKSVYAPAVYILTIMIVVVYAVCSVKKH